MQQYENNLEKLKEKQLLLKYKKDELEKLKKDITNNQTSIDNYTSIVDKLQNHLLAAKLLGEKVLLESKINLENFLSFAMQEIFTDKNYSIKLELKDNVKNPALEILLVEDNTEQLITDAIGGGIISVLGLLCQIYYIEVYNINKIMFIDEGLKEVSKSGDTNYLDNVLAFLKFLSEERGYKFVIITHDSEVVNIADRVYTVSDGVVKEVNKYDN